MNFRLLTIALATLVALLGMSSVPRTAIAKDYIVVIAGGPNKEQNQASMEANVLFFLRLMEERQSDDREISIFFSDGPDAGDDVQVLIDSSPVGEEDTPLVQLLKTLSRRGPGRMGAMSQGITPFGPRRQIAYRDHKISNALPTDPKLIRERIREIASVAKKGDRILLYVTAHGGSERRTGSQNTSIYCWEGEIRVRELADWLSRVSPEVPIYHVMAQCYTGGFANLIFRRPGGESDGLSPNRHVGFFAQQYDLPAAGCRPDIEVDEEYSSYFWGAISGHMRNGQAVEPMDLDADGYVSFAEAHAFAVATSRTIDVPLKSSDLLLRRFSRISNEANSESAGSNESLESSDKSENSDKVGLVGSHFDGLDPVVEVKGSLADFMQHADIYSQFVVRKLCAEFEIETDVDLQRIPELAKQRAQSLRRKLLEESAGRDSSVGRENQDGRTAISPERSDFNSRRGGNRRRSIRRELISEIQERWPEIKNAMDSSDFSMLTPLDQDAIVEEIQDLPLYANYIDYLRSIQMSGVVREEVELLEVKFRRLVETLELVALERNLDQYATEDIVNSYRELRRLELAPWFAHK